MVDNNIPDGLLIDGQKNLFLENYIQTNEYEENDRPRIRYFKCCINGNEFGRFVGKKPGMAAKKVFNKLLSNKMIGQENDNTVYVDERMVFQIRECTQGTRNKKNYYYTGKTEQYETPYRVEMRSGGAKKVIQFTRMNHVRKLKKSDVPLIFFGVDDELPLQVR
jgi:hypothetical protein